MYQRYKYNNEILNAYLDVSIVVLIGPRQVGKTSIMNSVPLSGTKHFVNGQDPEMAANFSQFSTLKEYLRIHLNENMSGTLIIDEFQYINGISLMLKLLADTFPDLKILCSGSSSLDILQKVEESLAGRVRVIEVFPLSFAEYLQFTNDYLYQLYQKYNTETPPTVVDPAIQIQLNEYLVYGGMPRAVLANDSTRKINILNDIYSTYLLRDVRNFVKNEDVVSFNKLLKILATQTGCLVNINELSVSSGLSYKKTDEYLYLLEQMYIIKLVAPYFTSKRKVIGKMRKLYFTDIGMRNIIYNNFNDIELRTDNGALFENYVYIELLRNLQPGMFVNYYRSLDGAEVDFVVNTLRDLIAVEAKYKKLKKTVNIKSLNSFCEMENVSSAYIINCNLNTFHNNTRYLPGYFTAKLRF